jgi:hypothetical protein
MLLLAGACAGLMVCSAAAPRAEPSPGGGPDNAEAHNLTRAPIASTGYGLFRTMTGVGQERRRLHNSGGAALRAVARPELEVQASDDGEVNADCSLIPTVLSLQSAFI